MKINILAVGNIKETYFVKACEEYAKRLGKFCDLNIIEIQEKNKLSTPEQCLYAEAKDIEKHLTGFVVVMDKFGKKFDSVSFSKKLEEIKMTNSTITFVIGSSFGLDQTIKQKANLLMSVSDMTFPHQLFRVLLLEQIYRAFCIENNITYHK
ncbi:MAG: 23S rRNA (pseudouridine(1915)-N(3))-methyltransferase RlmH [Christensenellales bacterium]